MFDYIVHTEIDITAPPERVWQALTDLAAYPDWNPMIRRASGEVEKGARLIVYFHPPGSRGRVFRPKLKAVEPNRELRWQGQPGFPFLLESEHVFIIQPTGNNKIHLIHDMIFYGLLVPFVKKIAKNSTHDPFVAMNRALKIRVEKSAEE